MTIQPDTTTNRLNVARAPRGWRIKYGKRNALKKLVKKTRRYDLWDGQAKIQELGYLSFGCLILLVINVINIRDIFKIGKNCELFLRRWGISCINTIFGLTLFYRRWVIWLDGGLRGYCVATNCILVRDLCKCRGLAEPGLTLRCLWTLWSCSSVSPMSGVLVTGHPVTQIAINTCRQLKSLMCHPQC